MTLFGALHLSRRPAAAFAVIGLFWGAFAAHVPVFKARLAVGDGAFGLLMLGTGVGLVSAMWLAPMLDRRLGAAALPVASVLFIAMFWTPAVAGTPAVFFAALLALGMASGLTDVVMNTRVAEMEAAGGKPLMNANHGVFSLAYAAAALASGWAREGGVGAAAVFAALMLLCLPLALSSRQAVGAAGREAVPGKAGLLAPVLLCGAVVLIAFMTEATVETWSALHIERTLSGSAAQGAAGPAVLGLTMAFGRFSGQSVAARFDDAAVMLGGVVLAVLGVVLVAAGQGVAVAYLGFGAMGLGVSVIGPIGLAMVARMVPDDRRAAAISRVAVIGFAGFFVAPVIMGQISERVGLQLAFGFFAGLLLLVVPLLGAIRRRLHAG